MKKAEQRLESQLNQIHENLDANISNVSINDNKVRVHMHNHVLGDDGIWMCACGDGFLDDEPDL